MIAIARNDSSMRARPTSHSSLVGGRTVIEMASLGHDFTQLAHRLQFAIESMVRGKVNSGQAGVDSVPL